MIEWNGKDICKEEAMKTTCMASCMICGKEFLSRLLSRFEDQTCRNGSTLQCTMLKKMALVESSVGRQHQISCIFRGVYWALRSNLEIKIDFFIRVKVRKRDPTSGRLER